MHEIETYIKILSKQERPIKFLISRVLKLLGFMDPFKIKKDGYSLLLQPSSLSLSLWVNPNQRQEDVDLIKLILRSGGVFYDVGANIGQLSIEAALIVGPSGSIIAFEAHPKIAYFFRNNIEFNKLNNIRLVQAAVGETCGWLNFSDNKSDDENGVLNSGGIKVPVFTLDTFLDGSKIDLLKIDVEGYELFVLKGALETLKYVDFIMFEAWDRHFEKFEYQFTDLCDYLWDLDFTIGRVDSSKNTVSIVNREDAISNCINLLAWRNSIDISKRLGLSVSGLK